MYDLFCCCCCFYVASFFFVGFFLFFVVVVPFVCFGKTDPVVAKITGACIRSAKYWVLVSLYERLVDRARLDDYIGIKRKKEIMKQNRKVKVV